LPERQDVQAAPNELTATALGMTLVEVALSDRTFCP
jgi:hypothetical protein